MKALKKIQLFLVAVMFVMLIAPILKTKAISEDDIPVISETSITITQAKEWARKKNATETFINLADLYWKYAKTRGGVNPALAYVQAAKETGYGRFGGVLDESYYNPCGLKTSGGGGDLDPNAHHRFNNWDEGVQAHLDHLALYAGAPGYPRNDTYDPRHFPSIAGKAPTAVSLGGKWAPSATYGNEVYSLYKNLLANKVGWFVENGKWYYYDRNGLLQKDWFLVEGKWYYSNSNGERQHGWLNQGGKKYYLDKNSGIMQIGLTTIDGKLYYFNQSGHMQTGWSKIESQWYFFDTNGMALKGWLWNNGAWYYLKDDYKMAKGLIDVNNEKYYLNDSGIMQIGWHFINNSWYYFSNGGAALKGWQLIDNAWYYMNNDFKMHKGLLDLNGNKYYLADSGRMQIGWNFVENNWYYFEDSGRAYKGWKLLNGAWYYLKDDYKMATGLIDIGDKKYFLNKSGIMQTGWVSINSTWYYFDKGGAALKDWQFIDNSWYYMDREGKMHKGWLDLNGNKYYLADSGRMHTDWLFIDNNWYYFNKSGSALKGWQAIDNSWYYMNDDYKMHKGWLELGENKYYLNSNGKMVTGWTTIGADVYFFDKISGYMYKNTVVDGYEIGPDGKRGNRVTIGKTLIVIDPGHSPMVEGAFAIHNGVKYSERVLNMQVAIKLKSKLEDMGFIVLMTLDPLSPGFPKDSDLKERVKFANDAKADLFVSIHQNSFDTQSANGTEVWYAKTPQDEEFLDPSNTKFTLAERISKSESLANDMVNLVSRSIGTSNRGAKTHYPKKDFFVNRNTSMPSVLVECVFITNYSDLVIITDEAKQQVLVDSIVNSITKSYKR